MHIPVCRLPGFLRTFAHKCAMYLNTSTLSPPLLSHHSHSLPQRGSHLTSLLYMNIRFYICEKYRLSTITEKMVYLVSGSYFTYYEDLWLNAYFVLQANSLVLYPFLACVYKSIYIYVCACMRVCMYVCVLHVYACVHVCECAHTCACLCLSFFHICSPDGQHLGQFCPLVTVKSIHCLCSMLTESPPGTYQDKVWLDDVTMITPLCTVMLTN